MRPTARRRFLARLAALPALAPAAALAGTCRPPAPDVGAGDVRFSVAFEEDTRGRLLCRARVECPAGTFDRAFAPDSLPRGRRFGFRVPSGWLFEGPA